MSSHQKQAQNISFTKLTQDGCNDNNKERNNKLMVHICSIVFFLEVVLLFTQSGVDFMRGLYSVYNP